MATDVEVRRPEWRPEESARVKPDSYFSVVVLLCAATFFAYDIALDVRAGGEGWLHITLESLMFVAVLVVLLAELRRVSALKHQVRHARHQMARLTGELLEVMRGEFARWGLSPSESEVALLLIKGLSMREISDARGVREKTVRQQATSVYAKSGCAGRHELGARFIEDLLGGGPGSD